MGRMGKERNLKCETCNDWTNHILEGNDYNCSKCDSKKFIGFPEYACHYENQRECIIDNHGMNTTWCLGCPSFY